ncbi:MAG: hemolysin family protein [Dehalococcoidales bacterium]|nr:hemolysin family protein [Dehalococcoidales bacterium]
MDTYSTMGWIALAVFALLSAFGAAAQEAITPINQMRLQRLEEAGMQRSKAIEKLLEQSEVIASTLLLLNILALAGATAAAVGLAVFVYGGGPFVGILLGLLLVGGLLFLQMMGKALAVRNPRLTAHVMEGPVHVVKVVLLPGVSVVKSLADRLMRLLGVRNGRPAFILNEEALYLLIGGDAAEEGETSEEHAMIHRIVELEDKAAREIMVPRIDVFAAEKDTPVAELLGKVVEMGYSRIPVYEESIDNVVGILYAKDLLGLTEEQRRTVTVGKLVRPAYFIPESKRIDELLHDLKEANVHMAIVVDEYGGTAGLVTIEDMLEEIVGEIRDEFDAKEEERIQVLGEREAIFDAGVSIDDVNRTMGLELEAEGYDTLGGLVYDTLGKMPEPGDRFTIDGVLVSVLSTEGRRIGKVRMEEAPKLNADELAADGGGSAFHRAESVARSNW